MNLDDVRLAVKNSGLKIGVLAKSIGVGRSTLSRFINGKSVLRKDALSNLIQVLKNSEEALKKNAS